MTRVSKWVRRGPMNSDPAEQTWNMTMNFFRDKDVWRCSLLPLLFFLRLSSSVAGTMRCGCSTWSLGCGMSGFQGERPTCVCWGVVQVHSLPAGTCLMLSARCCLSSFHPPRYPWRLEMTVPLLEMRKLDFGSSRTQKRSRKLSSEWWVGDLHLSKWG